MVLEDYLTKKRTIPSIYSIYTVTIYVIFEKWGLVPDMTPEPLGLEFRQHSPQEVADPPMLDIRSVTRV